MMFHEREKTKTVYDSFVSACCISSTSYATSAAALRAYRRDPAQYGDALRCLAEQCALPLSPTG
jgi:hypothetical protein